MPEVYRNYVDGQWTTAGRGETFASFNPADPSEVIGEFQRSSREDAETAIAAATAAQDAWAGTPGPARGQILHATAEHLSDNREQISRSLAREEGKALPEADGEVARAIDIFRYYGEMAREYGGETKPASGSETRLYTVREPLGTVGLITPWNYPIAIPSWKIAPALATGNTVVFKPASTTPNTARLLVEALDDAGLPAGVLNMVTGPGREVGNPFTTDERIDGVSFTGSSSVGMNVYRDAAAEKKRVQTEMGGKNPAIVMPSADMDRAAEIVAGGAFGVTGQACTATSRAIVHDAVYDDFLEALVDRAEAIDVGPALDGADMGPQATQSELDGTLEYIEIGEEEGATVLTGGSTPSGELPDAGYFVEPTVFADVEPDVRVAQEEIFGPVVSVIRAADFENALAIANDVEYGLSASIITQDLTEANRFTDEIEAGVVKVNDTTTGVELHVPFGGVKLSSSETFREQGTAALDFYTMSKTVYVNY
ncbi:MAG: aldehyde dehydrogenase family protein [Halobacteriales archaeon]|nr:aldehyde dehydrogenase family protein [Halobacteriales archaeon]